MINPQLLLIAALIAFIGKVAHAQIAFVEDQDIDKKKANLAVSCSQTQSTFVIRNAKMEEKTQPELGNIFRRIPFPIRSESRWSPIRNFV